jgi:hypothetical protein
MAKSVWTCRLGDSGFLHRLFYRLLQHGLVQMVPAPFSRNLICKMTGCRKYPLPTQLFPRVGIFALKRIRQSNSAQASLKIASVEEFIPSRCFASGSFTAAGSIVCRSLSPLPARTTIWLLVKSISFTRRRKHSISRRPAP